MSDRFKDFTEDFVEGPGRAYCYMDGGWWHFEDGFWSKPGAGAALTGSLRQYKETWARENYPNDWHLYRLLVTNQINAIKRRLQGYLRVEGIPGRLNEPKNLPTAAPPPPSVPPAPPAPAEPAPTPESGPLEPPGTGVPAG